MKKLNGYRPTHKNKWLFIQHGILSVQELALLEFYADILDFDKNHPKHGTFEVDFNELQPVFCKAPNTLRNWHNRLLKLGFIKESPKKNIFELVCFSRYITPGFWGGKAADYARQETNQPVEIILQNFGIELQQVGKLLQPVVKKDNESALKSDARALSSSKDESKVYQDKRVDKIQKITSDEEYQQVKSRVERLGELIGDNWFSGEPKIQKLVQEHESLASKMLEYEIEHDLLPI